MVFEIGLRRDRDRGQIRVGCCLAKKESMSQSGWYHDRAAECDRKAVASRNPVTRSRHIKDRDSWQTIADSIDAEEKAVRQKKNKRVRAATAPS
jgi:hypothetical protein